MSQSCTHCEQIGIVRVRGRLILYDDSDGAHLTCDQQKANRHQKVPVEFYEDRPRLELVIYGQAVLAQTRQGDCKIAQIVEVQRT
jgi:hypothetical protein